MKKLGTFLLFSALTVFALVVLFPSCEGPQGPAGVDGVDGTDGTDGVDANSFCVNCHTLANKTAINAQFATSSHGPMNGSYARGSAVGCAKCHAYQGYMETNLTGRDTTAAGFAIPLYFRCDMCHDFHQSLDESEFPDYALRFNNPVSLMYNNHASTIDLPGTSNLCAYCHQPRPRGTDFPIIPGVEKEYNITSSYWGTHYGVESIMLNGSDGVEFPGSLPYESTNHKAVASCGTCHMAAGHGTETGGHTFRPMSEAGVPNVTGCLACHPGITNFDVNGVQTHIHELFLELEHKLMEHKLIDATFHAIPWNNAAGTGAKWTTEQAGAVFNFLLIEYDASYGVHNHKYAKALLVNTLEVVAKW